MENVEKLKAEYRMVLQERVKLEIERYKLLYSNEKFEMPEILISHNFKEDVINTYKECHYPDTYGREEVPLGIYGCINNF